MKHSAGGSLPQQPRKTPYCGKDMEAGVRVAKLAPECRTAGGSCNAMEQMHVKAFPDGLGLSAQEQGLIPGDLTAGASMGKNSGGKRKEMRDMQTLDARKNGRRNAQAVASAVSASTAMDVPAAAVGVRQARTSWRKSDECAAGVAARNARLANYVPRGRIVPFMDAVRADPERIWTIAEISEVIGMSRNKVGGSLTYALRNKVLFRQKRGKATVFRGVSFPEGDLAPPEPKGKFSRRIGDGGWTTTPEDPRVPKVVPGWRPPVMVCVRGL